MDLTGANLIKHVLLNGTTAEKKKLFEFDINTPHDNIRKSFKLFARYHYPRYFKAKAAPFHDEFIMDMIKSYFGENVLSAAYRGSSKTSLKKLFDVYVLLNDISEYRKYIKVLSRDGKNSKQIVTDVYNLIVEAREIYGNVFEKEGDIKREETMSGFTMKNGRKYTAGTVGQSQRGHVQDAYRPDYCHAKGTLIFDKGKWLRVEEHSSFKEYKKEIGKEVKLNGLPFSENVTYAHRYWVKRIIKNSKQKSEDTGNTWLAAALLTKNDYIGTKIDYSTIEMPMVEKYCPKITERNKKGEVISTESGLSLVYENKFNDNEWWWFFGLFWGDGNLGGRSIAITVADKDVDVFNKLTALLDKYKIKWQTHHYNGACFRVQFSNAVLRRWLKKWYIGGNSRKVPPQWVENIDTGKQKELIRGYIDADGWFNKKEEEIKISSVCLEGLLCLRRILSRLDIPASIRHGSEPLLDYEICGVKCKTQKKYDLRFRENAKVLGYDIKNQTRYKYPRTFIKDGFLWSKVRHVTDTKEKMLFCPIETESHVYQTHYGLSHNCWFEDVEDRESIRSMVITQATISRIEEAINGLSINGSFYVTCNYISDQGSIQWLMNKPSVRTRITPLLSDPDDLSSSTWEVFTKEKVEQIKRDADDFYGEFLCDPQKSENKFFDLNRINNDLKNIRKPTKESAGVKYFGSYVPHHRYGMGSDHSEGIGADSNTLALFDFTTGELVATYANNEIAPDLAAHEFARVGAEFGNCIYAPETNAKCGGIVITALKNIKYPRLYRKINTGEVSDRITERLGWDTNSKTKYNMLFEFRKDYNDGLIKIYDKDVLAEMKAYTNNDLNETKAGLITRHFDLLMATLIAWQMRKHAEQKSDNYASGYKRYIESIKK